jgi:TRAP-type C4-dicarboxylate transport system substrate-binding protein
LTYAFSTLWPRTYAAFASAYGYEPIQAADSTALSELLSTSKIPLETILKMAPWIREFQTLGYQFSFDDLSDWARLFETHTLQDLLADAHEVNVAGHERWLNRTRHGNS